MATEKEYEPSRNIYFEEYVGMFYNWLMRLDTRTRVILILRIAYSMTSNKIALKLGISEGRVSQILIKLEKEWVANRDELMKGCAIINKSQYEDGSTFLKRTRETAEILALAWVKIKED